MWSFPAIWSVLFIYSFIIPCSGTFMWDLCMSSNLQKRDTSLNQQKTEKSWGSLRPSFTRVFSVFASWKIQHSAGRIWNFYLRVLWKYCNCNICIATRSDKNTRKQRHQTNESHQWISTHLIKVLSNPFVRASFGCRGQKMSQGHWNKKSADVSELTMVESWSNGDKTFLDIVMSYILVSWTCYDRLSRSMKI